MINKNIIICNWNEKGEKIVLELHSPLASPDTGIIVISKPRPVNEEELRHNYQKEYSNVEFREGSPVNYETLKGTNIHSAKAVIILTDDKILNPDAESALIALAINTIWEKRIDEEVIRRTEGLDKDELREKVILEDKFRKPRIIVEVLDHGKMDHLKDAGADDVICAADYAIGILAQSALNEKLSDVYHDLLTYSPGTNEIYILDDLFVSAWIKGKTFEEISLFFLQNRISVNYAIPVGIRRKTEAIINPKGEARFIEDDALIILAYDIPDLINIISEKR
jgi:Trk K+ transport system NAD-binding subunit